jgi:hypothetical protein
LLLPRSRLLLVLNKTREHPKTVPADLKAGILHLLVSGYVQPAFHDSDLGSLAMSILDGHHFAT